MDRAEERAAVALALVVGQRAGRGVEPLVHPAVVAREELAVRRVDHVRSETKLAGTAVGRETLRPRPLLTSPADTGVRV
jgi:hypothetical protein